MLASDRGPELTTWGEIAECLGVSIRKVQNHEKADGLPVYRAGYGPVTAFANELQAWKERRLGLTPVSAPAPPPPALRLRRMSLGAAILLVCAGIGAAFAVAHVSFTIKPKRK